MKAIAVVLALAYVLVATGSSAEPYLLNLSGKNFSTDEPGAVGQPLKIALQLSQVQDNPPMSLPGILDWSTEYTVYISGLMLASNPSSFQRNFTGGVLEIWAETPPNAPWTPTTPVASIPAYNASVVPATFTDGTMFLRGTFSSFTILDFTQFGSDSGTITNASIDFDGGLHLQDLIDLGIQNNWSWNGWFHVVAPVPPGYQLRYGGKLEIDSPTPVEPTTWGAIKALY